jgi:hypothetical protein
MKLLAILIIVGVLSFLFWVIYSGMQQSKKDWETLKYLKKKANEVSTKEEIEEFYTEFRQKSSKIYNKYICYELFAIDGYLRGLYKQYKNVE